MAVVLTLQQWHNALIVPREVEYISDAALATEVSSALAAKPAPKPPRASQPHKAVAPYQPTNAVGSLLIPGRFQVRPIDLLHCIGQLTTPVIPNLVAYAAGWAEVRYIWAFKPEMTAGNPLRSSSYARDLEPHQKAVLSDEIGIGMSGYIAATFLGAPLFDDFLSAEGKLFSLGKVPYQRRPDYCFFDLDGRPRLVLEAKGSQTGRSGSRHQLESAMEQLAVTSAMTWHYSPPLTVSAIAFATCLLKGSTRVFGLDPPGNGDFRNSIDPKDALEHLRKRLNHFVDPSALWTGQGEQPGVRFDKETVTTQLGAFQGTSVHFSPYQGTTVAVFRGLNEERWKKSFPKTDAPIWTADEDRATASGNRIVCRSYHPCGTLYQVSVTLDG